MAAELVTLTESKGQRPKVTLNFHEGQQAAYRSEKMIVAILAGTRGGKTSFGPWWLYREMLRQGPGDYLVVAPSFQLLDKAAAPEIEYVFTYLLGLGRMRRTPTFHFRLSRKGERRLWGQNSPRPTRIIFGHADDPEALEAMTAKAVWIDEGGQKRFKFGSWQAIKRRRSLNRGRILITTTPYTLGWLKQAIYDPWHAANEDHPLIDVVRFDSTANPAFPVEEWEQAQRDLPPWKFNMFFRAIFSRPAGLIYDNFDTTRHCVKRFSIPPTWERIGGLDFGGVNLVGLKYAKNPQNGKYHLYQAYVPKGHRSIEEHVVALKSGEPGYGGDESLPRVRWIGGSKSEEQWRIQFKAAGLPVQLPPIHEVELGINQVYAAHNDDEIVVFDDLKSYLDEKGSYTRKLDGMDQPTEDIEDKETYHHMDAERYAVSWWRRGVHQRGQAPTIQGGRGVMDDLPPNLFKSR